MARSRSKSSPPQPSVFAPLAGAAPLAARMRPRSLDEVVGQRHLLAPGKALRAAIDAGEPGSILFWGPPGSGKTTIARVIAHHVKGEFVPFSAVTDGVQRIREVVAEARQRLDLGRRTLVFIDEIHRFNRAQQDALLPHVEAGTITLVGATTENPSFEVNGALLSRMRVFVLEPLAQADVEELIRRALGDADRGLGAAGITADDAAIAAMAIEADGDARRALTILEAAAGLAPSITTAVVKEAAQLRFARYDKSGEEHYNLISAYHKALRGSDADGALYWLARMLQGGEDPLYVVRRMVRFAAEDIGLADPEALRITIAARDAYHFLGSPEGELAIAEACVYLATAPKSNKVYEAWGAASTAARETPAAPVPLHIRNAPTKLMKELGYGKGYEYAHSVPEAYVPQEYLPDEVRGREPFYRPGPFGFEKEIAKRIEWWKALKDRASGS
ncbi:MAG: replication-associated recombination protein A [Gemmatimonadota bacterium]|nr:replication-associated recombination protein A [Gemmatimonadota bacterium]